ncbi:hypothetical protein LSTR_LSTR016741, partial [Laodelphax striatellus]
DEEASWGDTAGTSGMIPPMSTEHMEAKCQINENKTIHPFAFRTHTSQSAKWFPATECEVMKMAWMNGLCWENTTHSNHRFLYPVENDVTVKPNDILAARCTMESHRQRITYIG